MKKTALALALVLTITMMFGVQFVSLAEANFNITPFEEIEPIPGTIPPKITILSPTNYAAYSGNAVNITIYATGPQPQVETAYSGLSVLRYNIDNDTFQEVITGGMIVPYELLSEVTYSIVLYDLPVGKHRLTVFAAGDVYLGNYSGAYAHWDRFHMDCESIVFFSIDYSPIFFPEILVTACASVVAVIVGMGLFVYFKKRQRSQSP